MLQVREQRRRWAVNLAGLLPQPVGEGGGVPSRSGADLIPTAGGTAIKRDEVPTAMFSALDKYSAMMRARNAASAQPTQVSLLR